MAFKVKIKFKNYGEVMDYCRKKKIKSEEAQVKYNKKDKYYIKE
jgi:hypothetical protein